MIVQDDQSVLDATIQAFGTLEELFTLLNDNSLNVNSKLTSGQDLTINTINRGDENVKDFVVLKNITYNNAQGQSVPPLNAGDFSDDYSNDYY